MTLIAGSRIGSYEVSAQIGAGGMGEVYRASDRKLKRQVAIKVLPVLRARAASVCACSDRGRPEVRLRRDVGRRIIVIENWSEELKRLMSHWE
jgi:hypothetical protein